MSVTAVLYWRSRGLVSLAGSFLFVGLACWRVPLSPIPNIVSDVRLAVVSGLPGLASGIFFSVLLANPLPELEATAIRWRLTALRGSWLGLALVGFVAVGALGFWVRGSGGQYVMGHARDCALGLGLGAVSGCWLPRHIAWLPATAYVVACWLGGVVDLNGTPAWWAFPCYRSESLNAALAAAVILCAGGLVYLARDGWPLVGAAE